MTEFDDLVRSRGQCKSKLTRFTTFLNKFNETNDDIDVLQTRLEHIANLLNEFTDIQNEIEKLDPEKINPTEQDDFENAYFELVGKAKGYVRKRLEYTQPTPPPISQVSGAQPEGTCPFRVKLPTMNLPTFDGSWDQWLNFYDSFRALVHDNYELPDIQKLYYLRSSVTGTAFEVIGSLESSATNYTIAWNLLKERFENKGLITSHHIQSLFDIPPIQRESGFMLQKLLDETRKHIRALKMLKADSWDTVMITLLTSKLDNTTRREWKAVVKGNNAPTVDQLTQFLTDRCSTFDTTINKVKELKLQPPNHGVSYKKQHSSLACVTNDIPKCPICKAAHQVYECKVFRNLSASARMAEVKKLKLCWNCLRNHVGKVCTLGGCRICHKRHNTLLHNDNRQDSTQSKDNSSNQNPSSDNYQGDNLHQPLTSDAPMTMNTHCSTICKSQVLLSTAIILIRDSNNHFQKCRALLDSGSQSNFITREACNRLKLKGERINMQIAGINQHGIQILDQTHATIKSQFNAYQDKIPFLIIDKIVQSLPALPIDTSQFKIPENINLADPTYHLPGKVDILIGAATFWNLLCIGQIVVNNRGPTLQKTKLGWIVSGTIANQRRSEQQATSLCSLATEVDIQQQLQQFWKLEEGPIKQVFSSEEKQCEEEFVRTYKRGSTGRFQVQLPFQDDISKLGESKSNALKRLYAMERKFRRHPELKTKYTEFMDEYENLNHMSQVTEDSNPDAVYLPHHAVVREDALTTKLRVVFDGSCKTATGISLNDIMMSGPTIQQELFSIVLRFRQHSIVMCADVEKMYRQIEVCNEQRDCQRIVWRNESHEPVRIYRLNTITYGLTSSPFLAIRCLMQLAYDAAPSYPEASTIIKNDFYVDDLLTGAETLERAKVIKDEVTKILNTAGFQLRKWMSNYPTLLQNTDNMNSEKELTIGEDWKALGLHWNPRNDTLQYKIYMPEGLERSTKRSILSIISQIFDPLGLIGPVIIRAKVLMQQLWKLQIGWDESVPLEMHTSWNQYLMNLKGISDIVIPRHVMQPDSEVVELHGFCDASEIAYGACLYLKSTNKEGKASVKLLCAKSRVAPVKIISLPRLELCGALLLAQLQARATQALNISINRAYHWCDSTITLAWITSQPYKWKTFVANRVTEIQNLTRLTDWRHVKSKHNPADLISRGIDSELLLHSELWWHGPEWLLKNQEHWPQDMEQAPSTSLEEKKQVVALFCKDGETDWFSKYSSLAKLKRVVSYCFRFKFNALNKNSRIVDPLNHTELDKTMNILLRLMQQQEYSNELQCLTRNQHIQANSSLRNLNVFLDKDGLIKVGGRLQNSLLPYSQRHGIVLPAKHRLTELIIREEHYRMLHSGPQALLAQIRCRYWPISGRNAIRRVLRHCTICFRTRPINNSQLMGNLPSPRVTPARAFSKCGVDYAGPFTIKVSRNKSGKAYLSLFICLSTKAVHLELVSDLTTASFLNTFKRFISRRGKPSDIFSDNGTNFVGANNELHALGQFLRSSECQTNTLDFMGQQAINWHFIPPQSPHFGGIWESAVKSAKTHLKRTIGNSTLNFEELNTVFCMIEAVLNSRPLSPISTDPSDLMPLTPGHFLIGSALTTFPEHDIRETPINRLSRYQLLTQIRQHFWTRWSREYLLQLQQRTKWQQANVNKLAPGVMVIVKDDNLPPLQWRLGRIVEVHPGKDGIVRVASIRTSSGVVKRSIPKICVLPIHDEI